MITLDDIIYILPETHIAIHPAQRRDASRLLMVSREDKTITDGEFPDLVDYFKPGDCLVMNDTKVFHARLRGTLASGKNTEILLIDKIDGRKWKAMVKDSKKVPEGSEFLVADRKIFIQGKDNDLRVIEFEQSADFETINAIGEVPLPPYIVKKRKKMEEPVTSGEDDERYQSVMAKVYGSVAAPTASLHFTGEALDALRQKGVTVCTVTLHVGPGTFKPVDDSIEEYEIHREELEVPESTIETLKRTKQNGGKITAVGTTVVRALETMALDRPSPKDWAPFRGSTGLFIRTEEFPFRVTDRMVTNFHMPKSTLLLLVYSFGGKDLVKKAYRHAVEQGYRFLSYGDAMFIY